jgi:hypothetical protein
MLELFGKCELVAATDLRLNPSTLTSLRWLSLPATTPRGETGSRLQEFIAQAPEGNQAFIAHRLQTLARHTPTGIHLGHAGFSDLVAFTYNGLCVVDSCKHSRTLIAKTRWSELKNTSKAELVASSTLGAFLPHSADWSNAIADVIR